MPSAASEAAAQRVDDAVRAKDEEALRDAVSKDETRELGSLGSEGLLACRLAPRRRLAPLFLFWVSP